MKTETLEEFIARGGSLKRGETPEYKQSGRWRYSFKDLVDKPSVSGVPFRARKKRRRRRGAA